MAQDDIHDEQTEPSEEHKQLEQFEYTDERETILWVKQLKKGYTIPGGQLQVLHDVNFTAQQGEFVAITGQSGSGKTTLLALLGALDTPDSGEIWLQNKAVHKLRGVAAADFRREQVGFVFQLFYLLPNLTALENVMLPSMIGGHAPREAAAEALDTAES